MNGGKKCYISRIISASGAVGLSDYVGDSSKSTGLTGFEAVCDISVIYVPNAQAIAGLSDAIIDHCERLKDRFAIIDSLKGQTPTNLIKPRSTSYAALYYPWLNIIDPVTASTRLAPPGGHVAGIYSRTDFEKGIHKAPANQVVQGVVSLERTITYSEQASLNIQGINCIRAFTGRGIIVWGAKTLTRDPEWKYINVRRLLIYLEKSIQKGTQWAVFEPNNEATWAKVRQSVTEFLTRVWRDGALMGTKTDEAFLVKCDRTTMTQNDIDNKKLIALIGVAPVKPAEFQIFRVMHVTVSSVTSES